MPAQRCVPCGDQGAPMPSAASRGHGHTAARMGCSGAEIPSRLLPPEMPVPVPKPRDAAQDGSHGPGGLFLTLLAPGTSTVVLPFKTVNNWRSPAMQNSPAPGLQRPTAHEQLLNQRKARPLPALSAFQRAFHSWQKSPGLLLPPLSLPLRWPDGAAGRGKSHCPAVPARSLSIADPRRRLPGL